MGQILVRNLDDSVIAALRRKAQRTGVSLEEGARQALAAAVGVSRDEAMAKSDAIRVRIGRLEGEGSLAVLRADRDRDG